MHFETSLNVYIDRSHGVCRTKVLTPSNSSTGTPYSYFFFTAWGNVSSLSILQSVCPLASINSSVRPAKFSVSFFFILLIASKIRSAITPFKCALSVHLVIKPLTFVSATVGPHKNTFSSNLVGNEVSYILWSICELKGTRAVFLPEFKISRISRVVGPKFISISMLFVHKPFAYVSASVHVHVDALACCLIIIPVSFIHIAIWVNETAFPISHITSPVALEFSPVLPALHASALTNSAHGPATQINGSIA